MGLIIKKINSRIHFMRATRYDSMNGMVKHVQHTILSLEQLESRCTPTSFTWTGAVNNTWEISGNWTGGSGNDYPGWNGTAATTNDTATLPASTPACNMGTTKEIATLTLNNYTQTLRLLDNLTINSGGSMNMGNIRQESLVGTGTELKFTGGTFDWTAGNINYKIGVHTPPRGMFKIEAQATVRFRQTATSSNIGDDIENRGVLKLENTATVWLTNRPRVTNDGGTIDVLVNNILGLGTEQADVLRTPN